MQYNEFNECVTMNARFEYIGPRRGISMRHLTIRNVSPELARALEQEKRARGTSLNRTVLGVLEAALGVGRGRRSNGLAELAGTWSEEELARFEEAIAVTEQVDEELWR